MLKPTLELIIGPMFSGKSTELVRRLTIFSEVGFKVLYINNSLDVRANSGVFSTHNPNSNVKETPNFKMISVASLSSVFSFSDAKLKKETLKCSLKIEEYDVIGIDEAQFFSDLYNKVLELVEIKKKHVIVSGLDGTFERKKFGEILELVPICDTITKLSSCCDICAKNKKQTPGIFSKRKTRDSSEIVIGSKDSYLAVCRECFIT